MAAVLIKNGQVIDPANGIRQQQLDVLAVEGRIFEVGVDLKPPVDGECSVFDASGCLVCPGLVDLHVHCFPGGTPLGVDPDEWCLTRGVTTVVDAGSAGANNYPQFLKYLQNKRTRVLGFINISRVGLETAGCATGEAIGELEDLDDVDIQQCLECIKNNSDQIVGIKVRLSAQLANGGKNEEEALRRALAVSSEASLPVMVHHSFSTVPLSAHNNKSLGVPGSLRKGDVLTHLYHGFESTVIDTSSYTLHPSVQHAKERGVFLDIGHGMGGFSWKVAEIAIESQAWPDTISTDLHTESNNGPAYDLPTVMTKMLCLGMPLYEVIKAVTVTPATIVKRQKELGTLSPGSVADITILKLQHCDVMLEDCQMVMRRVTERLIPIATWREGQRVEIKEVHKEWPNSSEEYIHLQSKERTILLVKDESIK